jgi:secreted trypsin-like serine protease
MKKLILAAVAATVALAGSLVLAPVAQASNTPNIIGGTQAPSTPWAVQLIFVQDGGTYGCTGEQINASWVVTANHCADGTTSMNVYHSNSTTNRGTAARVNALYSAPSGDIALAHLASPYPLSSYPSLNLSYTAKSSGTGKIMGYGARANGASSPGLYQATENLTGSSTDAYSGRAQHLTGSDG